MYNPLEAHLRHKVQVEQDVSYGGNAEQSQARRSEDERPKIGALRRLRDSGADGRQGCFLSESNEVLLTIAMSDLSSSVSAIT